MLRRLFTEHPREVGESYFEHMGVAFGFGRRMLLGGLACFAHGFVPGWHKRTGSTIIKGLNARMVVNRAHVRPGANAEDHAHGFRDYGFGI